jgi:hypothetical protein
MAKLQIATVAYKDADLREFLSHFRAFMKEEILNPIFLGVNKIDFSAELDKEGHKLVVETNRALNYKSERMIKDLTRGFVGAWNIAKFPK